MYRFAGRSSIGPYDTFRYSFSSGSNYKNYDSGHHDNYYSDCGTMQCDCMFCAVLTFDGNFRRQFSTAMLLHDESRSRNLNMTVSESETP